MLTENVRGWIERATRRRVVGVKRIRDATSCLLNDVEVEGEGGRAHVILRRFTDEAWVRREPDVALHEAVSLQHATRASLPAPEFIAVDQAGEECGVPATLVMKIPGSVVLSPADRAQWIRGLANAAAQIHRVDAGGFKWKYQRYNERDSLAVPAWSQQPDAWNKAIDIVLGPAPAYSECFIHRDYHPSNVLWENGEVSGIVDWVNGCRGPAGIDVAWCRHNLANLHGVELADEFLAAYIEEAGSEFTYDPYWDLMTVVELLPGPPTMYEGWRLAGHPHISNAVMRERVDEYVVSLVAPL